MALPSFNAADVANIFVLAILADITVERSVVAFLPTSIAIAIARLLLLDGGLSTRPPVPICQ